MPLAGACTFCLEGMTMKTPIRRTLKTLAAVAASTGMIAMAATAASAHVKVDPDSTGANG